MSPAQLQQTEAQFEQAVVDYSKLMGWISYHAHDSRRSEPGFPDRVFVRVPRLLFVEFKTETGKLSAAQERWLQDLDLIAQATGPALVDGGVEVHIWRPSKWGEIQAVLR
jgi:hypothetical protein